MGARARHDDAAISETSAVIMARLNDRLLEVTRAIQQRLATEIAELRDDSGLLELLVLVVVFGTQLGLSETSLLPLRCQCCVQ